VSHSCWHQPASPLWPPFTPLPAAPQTTSVQLHIHTCHVVSHRTSHCAESCNLWQWHCSLAASRPPTSKVGCHMHHPTVHRYRALDHRVGPITSLRIDTNNRYGCRYPASGLVLNFPAASFCSHLPSVLWRCRLGVRKSIWPVEIEWWVSVWLSVGSEVLIVCIWSSWCHCHPKTSSVISCLI